MSDAAIKPPRAMSKLAQVLEKVPLSASSIYRLVDKGEFPAPIKLGNSATAWLDDEIDAWLEDRIRNRVANRERASTEQQERAKRGKRRGRKKQNEQANP